ncbi:uncharacterized protein SCHCODRAFT_01032383 [Schizophyllum commune H4-8]|uniref:uncharacterized protein n=1 Tax=Schizophyllum commune (strain H4-8 / FGSC 9210) TaxID=578458 RepID=UPI0021602D7F|nr:uncharacterized protein SCHCODRAFT_01032383 [Schizophyllum commune H4-8]KAI5891945.1 hypothetical protein SCHCODRAFT_01032383 [Schizophyllum commune H4-8]
MARHAAARAFSEILRNTEPSNVTFANVSGVCTTGELKRDEQGHEFRELFIHKGSVVRNLDPEELAHSFIAVVAIQHPITGKMHFDCQDIVMRGFTQTEPSTDREHSPLPGHNGIARLPATMEQLSERFQRQVDDTTGPPPNITFTAPVFVFDAFSPTQPPTPSDIIEDPPNSPPPPNLAPLSASHRIPSPIPSPEEEALHTNRDTLNEFFREHGLLSTQDLLAALHQELERRQSEERSGLDERNTSESYAYQLVNGGDQPNPALEVATSIDEELEYADEDPAPEQGNPMPNGVLRSREYEMLQYPSSRSSTASTPPPVMLTAARPASPVVTRSVGSGTAYIVRGGINDEELRTETLETYDSESEDVDMREPSRDSGEEEDDSDRGSTSVFFLAKILGPQSEPAQSSRSTTDPRLGTPRDSSTSGVRRPPNEPEQCFRGTPERKVRGAQGGISSGLAHRVLSLKSQCASESRQYQTPYPSPTTVAFRSGALALETVSRTISRLSRFAEPVPSGEHDDGESLGGWSLAGRGHTSSSDDVSTVSSVEQDLYAASLRSASVGELAALATPRVRTVSAPAMVSPTGGYASPHQEAPSDPNNAPLSAGLDAHDEPTAAEALSEEEEAGGMNSSPDPESDGMGNNSSEVDLPSLADISDLDDVDWFEKIPMNGTRVAEAAAQQRRVLVQILYSRHVRAFAHVCIQRRHSGSFGPGYRVGTPSEPDLSPSSADALPPAPITDESTPPSAVSPTSMPLSPPSPAPSSIPSLQSVSDMSDSSSESSLATSEGEYVHYYQDSIYDEGGPDIPFFNNQGEGPPPIQEIHAADSELDAEGETDEEALSEGDGGSTRARLRELRAAEWWEIIEDDWGDVIFREDDLPPPPPGYDAAPIQTADEFMADLADIEEDTRDDPHKLRHINCVMSAVQRVIALAAASTAPEAEQLNDYDTENEIVLRTKPEVFFNSERPSQMNMFQSVATDPSSNALFDYFLIYHRDLLTTDSRARRTFVPAGRIHTHFPPAIEAFPRAPPGQTAPLSFVMNEHRRDHGEGIADMGDVVLEARRALVAGNRHLVDWVHTNGLQEQVRRDMRDIRGHSMQPLNPLMFLEELYYLTGVVNILDLDSREQESDLVEKVIYSHPRVSYQTLRLMMRLGYLGGPVPTMGNAAQHELLVRGTGRTIY